MRSARRSAGIARAAGRRKKSASAARCLLRRGVTPGVDGEEGLGVPVGGPTHRELEDGPNASYGHGLTCRESSREGRLPVRLLAATAMVAALALTGCGSPTTSGTSAGSPLATATPAATAMPAASATATLSSSSGTDTLRQDMMSDLHTIAVGTSFVCVVMKSVRDKETPVSSLAGLDSHLTPVADAVTRIDGRTGFPQGWLTAFNRTKDVAETARSFLLEAGLAIGAQKTKGDVVALSLLPQAIGECTPLYQQTQAAQEAIDAAP